MKFKNEISPKVISIVFAIFICLFAISFYVIAWEEPANVPPGGNVYAPLNTSDSYQTKEGRIGIYTSDTDLNYGFIVGEAGKEKGIKATGNSWFDGTINATGDICTNLAGGKCLSSITGEGLWFDAANYIYSKNYYKFIIKDDGRIGIGLDMSDLTRQTVLNINADDSGFPMGIYVKSSAGNGQAIYSEGYTGIVGVGKSIGVLGVSSNTGSGTNAGVAAYSDFAGGIAIYGKGSTWPGSDSWAGYFVGGNEAGVYISNSLNNVAALDIQGVMRLQPRLFSTLNANGTIYYNSTSNKFKCYEDGVWKDCISDGGGGTSLWSENGSEIYYNSGNVGIGTNNPDQKLHIVGTGYATSDLRAPIFYDTNNTAYYIDPTSTSRINSVRFEGELIPDGSICGVGEILKKTGANDWDCATDETGGVGTSLWTDAGSYISANNYTSIVITDTGLIGVKDITPSYEIDVAGTVRATYLIATTDLIVGDDIDFDGELMPDGSTCANGQILKKTGDDNWDCATDETGGGGTSLWSENGVNIYYNSGNVGIGTNDPDQKLHIVGTGYATSDLRAPIFYDTNNTSYYIDPTSTSVFNSVEFDGELKPDGLACADGQILKKTGVNNWDCATDEIGGVGGIGGSGSLNYIPIWTGDTLLGNSPFLVDNSGDGSINFNNYKLEGVREIDPVFNIWEKKYTSYMTDMVGQKMEVVGQSALNGDELVIDFELEEEGSDLWLFWQTIVRETIIPFVSVQSDAEIYAYIDDSEFIIKLRNGEQNAKFSYRLIGTRLDHFDDKDNLYDDQKVEYFIDIDELRK